MRSLPTRQLLQFPIDFFLTLNTVMQGRLATTNVIWFLLFTIESSTRVTGLANLCRHDYTHSACILQHSMQMDFPGCERL